jgi:antitoxin PrlF
MHVSKLTEKYQATIPADIRTFLSLRKGDRVGFEIKNSSVIINKITPLDYEYMKSIESSMSEWLSDEDEGAYRDL